MNVEGSRIRFKRIEVWAPSGLTSPYGQGAEFGYSGTLRFDLDIATRWGPPV